MILTLVKAVRTQCDGRSSLLLSTFTKNHLGSPMISAHVFEVRTLSKVVAKPGGKSLEVRRSNGWKSMVGSNWRMYCSVISVSTKKTSETQGLIA